MASQNVANPKEKEGDSYFSVIVLARRRRWKKMGKGAGHKANN